MDRNKPILKTAVPHEWMEQLEMLAKQTGCSVSELLRDAIAQYLGICEQPASQTLDQFRTELNTFKVSISQLDEKVNNLSSNSRLLTTLSLKIAVLEEIVAKNTTPAKNTATSSQLLDDDDDCDEPDEILTDFLPR
jgi:Ribbon-helix-helix protein, copG family